MDRISAFMDGETSPIEAHQAILRLKRNDPCCETWKTFHLIGDVMRGDLVLRDDFTVRIRSLLQQEPTALVPRFIWRKTTRLALSAAASLAAVAVILTLVLTDNPLKPQSQLVVAPKPEIIRDTQTAALPQPVPAANQRRVNEYLMAHQGFSPSTTLQGLVLYARTVQPVPDDNGQ
jgi:sigma-E factor negative regulatory protein RseA